MSYPPKEGITREELARRIAKASENVPPLDTYQWKTIYLALARERRRIRQLIEDCDGFPPFDDDPDASAWIGNMRGKERHIQKIMETIGEQGRNMRLNGIGRQIHITDNDDTPAPNDRETP